MINDQNKSKVFLVIIAILLITNIAMLIFFLQKKEAPKQANRPDRKTYISNFLKNEIGFNQAQLVQYDTLSKQQREKMNLFFETMRNKKNEQFKELVAGDFNDSVINRLAEKSASSQKAMEVNMLTHIKSIRQLCTPAQQPAFDSLFVKVFNRRSSEARKKTINKK